jgi:hypothetical protein
VQQGHFLAFVEAAKHTKRRGKPRLLVISINETVYCLKQGTHQGQASGQAKPLSMTLYQEIKRLHECVHTECVPLEKFGWQTRETGAVQDTD